MSRNELRRHCLWLYGIIVGLAIREAIVRVLPHFTAKDFLFDWHALLEVLRLAVFLLVITRFYFGAAVVFRQIGPGESFPTKNDGVDLLAGLVHFLLFFGWATTIDGRTGTTWLLSTSPYLVFMGLVLVYDLFWWLMGLGRDHVEKLRLWMVLNVITLGACILIHLVGLRLQIDQMALEEICFFPVIAVSLIDVSEVLTGKEIFRTWLRAL